MTKVRRIRVLHVEDDPGDAVTTALTLAASRTVRFEVRHVVQLSDALDALGQDTTDVVLLDLSLPDARGLDGVQAIRDRAPEASIVVLTGNDDVDTAVAAIEKGTQDYLVKDQVGGAALRRSIRQALVRNEIRQDMARAQEELRRLAVRDQLTGLENRHALEQWLPIALERARRRVRPLAAVLVDLDDFKQVNDELGYPAGDATLREAAVRLQAAVRAEDRVFRIGGDEFLLVPEAASVAAAVVIATKARLAVGGSPFDLDAGSIEVTCSVGVAEIPLEETSIEAILERAGAAVRTSKRSGKNRATLKTGDAADEAPDEARKLVNRIVAGHGLRVLSIPLVSLPDQEVVARELLTRGPPGTFEQPRELFDLSMSQNLLTVVDAQCIRTALESADAAGVSHPVHVNVFPATITALGLDGCRELLGPYTDRTICLNLNERYLLGDPAELGAILAALQPLGVMVALEDVGFARVSLESVILLEVGLIKLHPRFLQDIVESEASRRMLARLVRVASGLDAQIVATGVETAEQARAAAALGVSFAQGFLWGEPAPL